jgi:hypothetical protein
MIFGRCGLLIEEARWIRRAVGTCTGLTVDLVAMYSSSELRSIPSEYARIPQNDYSAIFFVQGRAAGHDELFPSHTPNNLPGLI